ncbi:glycosyltransferase family 2 protein [Zoogloeaceae bacterium G21618-S1]|nr:glycosyltransferase family 2 protein [Zoogloeaceae bacterium G21618-S1]
MKISVVTCTWNSEPFLAESIASVLAQDYPDLEYVFVDGGSTDGTLERIEAIQMPVKVVHDVRGGISHAMNEGILAATGDIIAHLHSDDLYLSPTVLSQVAAAMADPAVGWCFGRINRLIDGQLIPEGYVAPPYSAKRLLRGNFIPHPATFVRRDWINQAGRFDESLKYAMDYDLWLKLAKMGPPQELNVPLAAFREHGGSLSSSNRQAAMAEDYKVRLSHCSDSPFARLEHRLRYSVRQRRLAKSLGAQRATA